MDMDPGMDMGDETMQGMGSMAFHGGCNEKILFEGWEISTISGLAGSMIGIIIISALYQGLRSYREVLLARHSSGTYSLDGSEPKGFQIISWPHILQTVLHMIQLVVAYLLMLIVMTYNYWLGLSVMIGGGLGYFIFGGVKSESLEEHCH